MQMAIFSIGCTNLETFSMSFAYDIFIPSETEQLENQMCLICQFYIIERKILD